MTERSPTDALADGIVDFVRAFGLHRPDQTPCGTALSVSDAHALVELAAAPRNQRELAERLHLTKSTVSRLVTQLEDRGWVRRHPDPGDGRAVRLELTDTGATVAERLATARRARFDALLRALPADRRADVTDALAALTEAARRTDPSHA